MKRILQSLSITVLLSLIASVNLNAQSELLQLVDTRFAGVGEIILNAPAKSGALSAVAVSRSGAPNRSIEIKDGKFTFFSGLDEWDILFAGCNYAEADAYIAEFTARKGYDPKLYAASLLTENPTISEKRFAADLSELLGFVPTPSNPRSWMRGTMSSSMSKLGTRASQVAVYYPQGSILLGNNAIDAELNAITKTLSEHQVDFDWVDDAAFETSLTVKPGYFLNNGGQKYRSLIIPSCDVISATAWKQIAQFVDEGGKLLFCGHRPSLLAGRSYMDLTPATDLVKNCFEQYGSVWSATMKTALPKPEFVAEGASVADIRYTRYVGEDAESYLVYNSGNATSEFTAQFAITGITSAMDASTGDKTTLAATKSNGKTLLPMSLKAGESKIIVIEKGKKEYNIKKYGVKADGKSQTKALQALIDRVYADGGGTIVVPAGTFMSGALFFPHGVDLRIEKRGVLKSVADDDEFPIIKTRFEGNEKDWKCAFLNFTDSKGVRVWGEGTIDGNGPEWNKMVGRSGYSRRPRLVNFTRCDGGSIKGLKLHNQALWCLHVLYCDEFTIDGLHIAAIEYTPSSDGIDLDSSNDILLTNTYIYCHDDCLSIKSGKDTEGRRIGRPAENIRVENCHFAYGHGGVDIGSEVSGSVRNVHAINCTFDDGNWGSIRFKSQPARGGVIENITFENFDVRGSSTIIDVNLDWSGGNKSEVPGYSDPVTQMRNIRIINCHGFGERLGQIRGYDCDPFKSDVFHFENCSFEVQSGMNVKNAENVDFSGLEVKVSDGPAFYKDGEFTPKPLVHRGSMNTLPQEGTKPLKK